MEFIVSNCGSKKLCYAGHTYTFKGQSKTSQRWECSQRMGKKCRTILTTDPTVVVTMGTMDSLQKKNARRNTHGKTPTEPASLKDIPVPFPSEYLKNLIYDNEPEETQLLVYTSEHGLRLLGEAGTWFIDGTYTTGPSQFKQIFCIRVAPGDNYQYVAYDLLPSKTQQTYEECLTALLDAYLKRDIRPTQKYSGRRL